MADPRKAWNWLAIPPAHHADSDWRDTTIAKRAQELTQADPGFIAISDERRDLTRREWLDEAWGSPYSTYWPPGAQATTTSVNLEHIVCSEWLRNGEIVRETGYARQDATI